MSIFQKVVWVYLVVGVLVVLSGPVRAQIGKQAKETRDYNATFSKHLWWLDARLKLAVLLLGLVAIALWPYFLLDSWRRASAPAVVRRPQEPETRPSLEEVLAGWPDVPISKVDWTYDVTCCMCNHYFQVSHWVLGQGNKEVHLCQCDRCSAVEYQALEGNELGMTCKCGGTLRREVSLRCTKCSSSKLHLRKHYAHII